jgi:cytochrome c-type biogenesis protein CcmH
MLTFWIIGAILTLFALGFVILPLLKKNPKAADIDRNSLNVAIYKERVAELEQDNLTPEQFATAKQELEKTLAQDLDDQTTPTANRVPNCWVVVFVAVFIPALTIGAYLGLGSPQLITPATATKSHATQDNDKARAEIDEMVKGLAARLEQQPDDLQGWQTLARSYAALGDSAQAIQTYNKILARFEEQPQILADFAQLLLETNKGSSAGLPSILVKRALSLDPNHQKALFISGFAAMEKADYKTAIEHWERLLARLSPQAVKFKQMLQQHIAGARAQLETQTAQAEKTPPTTPPEPAKSAAKIEVHVNLAPTLQHQVKPSDTLFIYAHATTGRPMPLAIVRKSASELPTSATLDDSTAMMPTMKLSNFKEVTVVARISRSGNAIPQPGDLQGQITPITLGKQDKVEITIDQTRP